MYSSFLRATRVLLLAQGVICMHFVHSHETLQLCSTHQGLPIISGCFVWIFLTFSTAAIFQDGRHVLGAFKSFFNILAYKAVRNLILVSIPMFMMLRNPINMIIGKKLDQYI